MNIVTKATLGLVAGATALTAASPAEAQWRRYHRDRGGDAAAAAIVGGIAGLAIGSAIANDRYRDRYYRGGYYDRGYYGPRYRGWNRGYYGPPRRFYRQRCFSRWQYDPYIGRRVRVRYC
ncbi:hypothetical protein [Sphingomonas sp.]|uniref:hypothetical protein n=1 Tax=Sphingomonas sp. TaxID=28214 RepID=UPI002C220DCC|nr:hypothetical protein [Sphingomonas sp.]HTG39460.1 hypothetical protein [Sphingomonas sp.]